MIELNFSLAPITLEAIRQPVGEGNGTLLGDDSLADGGGLDLRGLDLLSSGGDTFLQARGAGIDCLADFQNSAIALGWQVGWALQIWQFAEVAVLKWATRSSV